MAVIHCCAIVAVYLVQTLIKNGMEAKNFRLGNFLYNTEGKVDKVNMESLKYLLEYGDTKMCQAKPIQLTKEWLDKFGFDDSEYKKGYTGVDYRTNLIMDFVLTKPNFMGEWQNYYTYDLGQHRFVGVHYVHELQNLFFAITTTELELKELV